MLFAGFIFALLWFFVIYKKPLDEYALKCIIFISLLLSLSFICLLIARYIQFSREIPERILLTDSSFRIDNQLYPARQLTAITTTPTSHAAPIYGISFKRYITLKMDSSKLIKYQVGRTSGSSQTLIYEDYETLVDSIRKWCEEHQIAFSEDYE